jgi:hypothetical protein
MSQTIRKTINLFDTIKQCGYDNSKETLNRFVISIIFRTLLLIDAFHDFSNEERNKSDKSDFLEIYKALLNSYKNDLLHIFKVCDKEELFIKFFTELFENFIDEILLIITCKNDANPHFLTIDVNKKDDSTTILEKPIGIKTMSDPEKIKERIFSHLTFKEGLSEKDYASYSLPVSGDKKIGIQTEFPLFDVSMEINKQQTNSKYVIKKFIGKLMLNQKKLGKLINLDYSVKPLFIISYDNGKEFKISDESVLTKIILIINGIFTKCNDMQRSSGPTFMPISVGKLQTARDDLMKILDFTPKNKISNDAINNSPWGFVHNIICSKTNKSTSKKCNNTFNPSITFTIDAESQHSTKDYIIGKLEIFCKDQICTPKNLERIERQKQIINETTQLIKHEDIKESPDCEEGKKLNYIMQSMYDRVIDDKTKFKLATTTGTNFDAANIGNLGAYIEHHNNSFGIKHEKSDTYIYDITLVADDKSGRPPVILLHFIYTPSSEDIDVTVGESVIPIKFNFVELKIETWFSLIQKNKTHKVIVNYTGTESLKSETKKRAEALIKQLPEFTKCTGKGGFSLNKATQAFNNTKDVLDLHFKTATDTGQNLCLKALEMEEQNEEQNEENTLYILHTNDTFNGALGSLINPGTVIERTNELERINTSDAELEKKIDTLSDGKINMYVTSKTYTHACKTETASKFDAIQDGTTVLVHKLLLTMEEKKKEQERASRERLSKVAVETALREMDTKRAKEQERAATERASKERAKFALDEMAILRAKEQERAATERASKERAKFALDEMAILRAEEQERASRERQRAESKSVENKKLIRQIAQLEQQQQDEIRKKEEKRKERSTSSSSSRSSSRSSSSESDRRRTKRERRERSEKRERRKEEKEERKRREKSKKKREEKRREEKRREEKRREEKRREEKRREKSKTRKRTRSTRSFSRSPAQSRSPSLSTSPTSTSNSNTHKRRKVQFSNSKKRARSLTPTINSPSSSSPSPSRPASKQTRRLSSSTSPSPNSSYSPSASGKKSQKKN